MNVLVVDDERAIRNSLKEILTDEGYDVDTAEDGVQAVEKAGKQKFDVIFCDIKMPNMDGLEVLDTLVGNGTDAAVVMISGHGDISTAVECIKKGAFDFVEKPLDLNRVLITIKNATDRVHLTKQNKALKNDRGVRTDEAYKGHYSQGGPIGCTGSNNRAERFRKGTCSQEPPSAQ